MTDSNISNDSIPDRESSSAFTGKVFCVGMNKTGTSSMKKCFELLGLTPVAAPTNKEAASWDSVIKFFEDRDYSPFIELAANFRSFEDRPWNMWEMYRHLDEHYPGSRFILTVRDADSWWRSTERWIKVEKPQAEKYYLQHLNADIFSKEALTSGYLKYNEEVVRYFDGTGQLLIMNLEDGDGWQKLCNFLGMAIPTEPFPHENRQSRAPSKASGLKRLMNHLKGLFGEGGNQ